MFFAWATVGHVVRDTIMAIPICMAAHWSHRRRLVKCEGDFDAVLGHWQRREDNE